MAYVVEHLAGNVQLYCGDCLDVLKALPENSIDACITDPPYHLTSIVKRFGADNAAPARPFGKSTMQDKTWVDPQAKQYVRLTRGFMGKQWDGGDIAFRPDVWREVLRVLKPGGHLLSFGGTRTYHRMACAIEDAGFEIRDAIMWLYGSGFPKSHDVSKAIDRAAGAEREVVGHTRKSIASMGPGEGNFSDDSYQWQAEFNRTAPATAAARQWSGFGTALKPACEPIVLARKPLSESTVAANVLKWGTGALNIDGCRVGVFVNDTPPGTDRYNQANFEQGYRPGAYQNGRPALVSNRRSGNNTYGDGLQGSRATGITTLGRWPANVIHDGSEEVVGAFPDAGGGYGVVGPKGSRSGGIMGETTDARAGQICGYGDSGSAARFFYTAKADADDRLGSKHPTVKPLDLMQYLVRLITPPRGLVLDPFAGTGTTGEAAMREGMRAVLIEREEEYQHDIRRRMKLAMTGPDERFREAIKARTKDKPVDHGPLFNQQSWTEMWAKPFDFNAMKEGE